MKDGKKTKSILKGASFFLATFAFVGMLAMGTRFVKHKDYNNAGSQIVAVAAVGDTASIEYKYKVGDGAYNVVDKFVGEAETVHTFGQTTNLVDGKVAGYYFRGWYDNADCTGDALTTLDSSLEGNQGDTITLYAKLEVATTRTLTAQTVEHGTYHLSSTTGRYGEEITLVADTADENYEIKGGYYTDTDGNNRVDFVGTTFECPDFDALVYATFGLAAHSISFEVSNGGDYGCSYYLSKNSAVPGEEITITIELAEGYGLKFLGYMSGEDFVSITQHGENENEYVFTMPSYGVDGLIVFGETFDANWTQFKSNHSSEIVNNVTTFISATNMQNEEGDTYIDTNVYARISGDTLYLFSTNSNKVVLPRDCTAFFADQFSNARYENLTNVLLDNLDASNVTDMSYMFIGCEGITNLDLSSFDTSSLVNMDGMFQGCSSLTNIVYGENFDTSHVTAADDLFKGCDDMTTLDLSCYDFSGLYDADAVRVAEVNELIFTFESTASKIIMPKALPTTYYDAGCNYSDQDYTYNIVLKIKVNNKELGFEEGGYDSAYSYKLQNNNFATTGTCLNDFPVSTAGTKQVIYRADLLHDITTDTTTNGSVSVEYSKAIEGETVTINATPASGYDVEAYYYYQVGSPENKVPVENATFSMPNYDVVVGAEFTVPSAIIYKNEGGADFVGNFDGNYPTTHTNLAKELKVPTRAGYHFAGWYLDQACTKNSLASQEWDSELGVNVTKYYLPANQVGDTTVYAKWAPTLNMTLWEAFKEDYATALANVERVTTLVNQEVQTGDSQLGENIYARIYDNAGTQTLVLYSTTDKIYLYDDSKQFFADAFSNVVSMDLTKFDTTYVTDISEMFNGCSALTSLDLSSFVLNDGVVVSDVFTGCNTLQTIYTPQRYPLLTGDDHIDLPGYWTGDGFGGYINYMEYFTNSTTENRQEISRVVLFEVNVDPNQGFGTINWAEGSVLNMVAKNAAVTVEGANVLVNGVIVATAEPNERYGYDVDFNSWSGLNTIGTDSVSLTASFTSTAHTHTVTFDTNGGTLNEESQQVVFGENYGVLPTPTREGYVFDGWIYDSGENYIETFTEQNTSNTAVYETDFKLVIADNQEYPLDQDITIKATWTKENWLSDNKWEMFKIGAAEYIADSVTKIKTATNMTAYEEYGDYALGGGNYARIDGDTLWIFSTSASKIILPEDASYFFYMFVKDFREEPQYTAGYRNIFENVEEMDLSNFDTSNVKSMRAMFATFFRWVVDDEAQVKLTELDLSNFNTANVTDMSGMFAQQTALTNLNISNFNTSNVTNMGSMFLQCESLTSLNLSHFDTSNVTDMSQMFKADKALTTLTFGNNFNTSNVTDMNRMFAKCNNLTALDVTGFDTSNVTCMSLMFAGCNALTSLDLSSFDLTHIYDGISEVEENESYDLDERLFDDGYNCKTSFTDLFTALSTEGDRISCDNLEEIVMPKTLTESQARITLPGVFKVKNDEESPLGTSMWEFADYLSTQDNRVTLEKTDVSSFSYILYELDGGTANNPTYYTTSTPTFTLNAPVKEGYTFLGWIYPGQGEPVAEVTITQGSTGDKQYMAIYAINEYTLTFVVDGENYQVITQNYGTTVTPPADPTKEGHTFTGWSEAVPETMPAENKTITANFEQVATTLDKALWEDYKETYKNDILNVRTITTATNTAAQAGDVSIGNGVYARISGETLTIFSINDSKIILPENCSMFFLKYANTTINDEWIYSYFQKITTMDLSNFDTSNVTNMWEMFHLCRALTSLDLSGFDTSNVTNMRSMFSDCQALTSLDVSGFDTSNVTNMSGMFNCCYVLTSLDLGGFDTSNVTNMRSMFSECSALTSLDVSGFDTSNVTDIRSMFHYCPALTSLDLSGFNTSNVTDMSWMFYGCDSLTSLDVSGFNTSNVTNMEGMFYSCQALTSLDVSGFNTANVTNMGGMFSDCSGLTSLDLSSFDMTKVATVTTTSTSPALGMFNGCSSLTDIYVPKVLPSDTTLTIDLPGVTYGTTATYGLANNNYQTTSANLMDFPVSVIDTENPENTVKQQIVRQNSVTANVNNNSYGAVTGDLTYYAGQTITEDGNTLKVGDTVIATATPATIEGYTVEFDSWNLTALASNNTVTANFTVTAYTTLDKTLWEDYKETYKNDILNVRTITTATNMVAQEGDVSIGNGVYARISGETLIIFSINDSKIILPEDCSNFFYKDANTTINDEWIYSYFKKITTIDLANFDTINVTNMYGMFSFCEALTSLDVSGFNTSNVTNMQDIFNGCFALTSLNLSNFNTSNVTDMSYMFSSCRALTSLNLSGFNTSKVTSMQGMFQGCLALTSLDVSDFNTSKVTSMEGMFNGCSMLECIDVTSFDTTELIYMGYMFQECQALTSLDLSNFDMSGVTNAGDMFNGCSSLTDIYTPKALPSDTTLTIDLPATFGLANDNYQTTGTTLNAFPVSTVGNKQQIVRQNSVTANVNNNSYGAVTGDLTYYAGQTITEDGNTLKVGDTVIATATPATIEGYTVEFDSWDLTALASSNTVTANFTSTINEYTITFVVDGENYQVITQNYGTEVIAPTDPTKTGYTFTGWSETVPETMPAENKTITANFEINQYTITFVLGNGEENVIVEQDYGTTVTPPVDPTKTGYTFTGWSEAVPETMPAENKTITANFEINQYTITFVLGNGEENVVVEQDYGTAYNMPMDPERTGYTFGGWDREVPATIPAENITINATWTAVNYTITLNGLEEGDVYDPVAATYTIESGDITLPTNVTRERYTFLGWTGEGIEEPTKNVTILAGSTGNKTYTANFELSEFNVYGASTTNGSLVLSASQVVVGDEVVVTLSPDAHYEVDEVYYATATIEKQAISQINGEYKFTMPAEDVTVYATFKQRYYKITQDQMANGHLEFDKSSSLYGETVTVTIVPDAGYELKSGAAVWYYTTDPEQPTPIDYDGLTGSFTMPGDNVVVCAEFEAIEYTLTLKQVDTNGAVMAVITQKYNTEIDYRSIDMYTEKTGYTFTNTWSEFLPTTMPLNGGEIYGIYEINQYTITFVLGNGEENVVVEQDYGTAYSVPMDPERTGYTFGGWDREVPATIPAENITINATWTANEYTLTIKENDTYGAVIATITQGYGTTIDYSGVNTTKYGYTFGGYSDQPQTMPLDGGEIYAYFTANGHTLYFNANGGYVDLQSTEVTYGQEYGALPIPTRDGYTFLGWYDTNGFLKADDEVYNLDGDTTFTANWQTITYKIILIINNEVASQIHYTIESSDYTLADAQEPTGYSFLGWTGDGNTTPRKGVIIRSGSMGDKVFTAKFEANRYDIEYRDYGTPGGFSGTTDGLPTFHIYDQATTLVESTRTGYKFVGWMLNGEMITRIAENTVAGNITLDAVWEANSYDIVYRDKNNTTFSGLFAGEYPEKYTYDRNTTLVSPTRVGYDFVGWFSDAACTQPITQIPAGYDTQAVTVYADWTAQQYTITYRERYGAEFGGTTAGLPTTHTYDQTTVLGTTTKEGYTFAGWYTDEDCQNQVNQIGAFTKTENFYLYAKFDANKYDIVYKDQNGADYTGATEGLPTQFVYDEQTYLPTPTRAGYDFAGWFLDQECEYQQITEIPSKYASQAVTVYAKWNEATFTVYFNTNGGYMPSGNGSMNATYLSAYGDIETPEKEYYDFAGWYSDAALTNAVNADTIYNFTQDSNLYAKWTPTVYTITLHIFNNDQTVEFTVESDSFTLAHPQVEGYTFVEWLRDGSSVGADYNPTYNEAENYELTANFEAIEYTYKLQVNIELTDDQGNPVFDPEVYNVEHAYTIEDDDIALPNIDVSQYGVFFRGWTGEGLENPTTDVVIAKGSIGNRVYVAHFTGEPFTMTFDALGGEVSVESMEVRYQEEIGALPQATKDGYTFAGWYRDQACTDGNEITADMLLTTKGDFTAYAKWKANAYKIRRNIDGVTFVTLYSPDDKAFNLPIPTKRGYKFVGWTGTDLEEMQRVVTIASGSIGDKEYVAHFELATYIITLQVNGETYDEIEYTMESRDIKIGEIEVDGYTFNGWTGEGITTPTKEIVVEMGSVGNKLYKANLTAHTYTATITIDGEEREIEFTPNSEDIVIQNPTKDGYVFLGWQAEGSTELVKNLVIKKGTVGDQAYTAVWEEAKSQEEKAGMNKTLVIGISAGAGGLVLATGVTLGVLKLKKRRR